MADEVTDEWQTDLLDLEAYLRRISYAGSTSPDLATLKALHRAHLAAIPFENLDVILDRGISTELENVEDKLVRGLRGGYCFEQGTLFAAVLERLGYDVTRLIARTGDDDRRPRARTHLVLKVRIDGEAWLADVGFGSGLLEPLPLKATGPRTQGEWTLQLESAGINTWRFQELQDEVWVTMYTFTEEPQRAIDLEVANHYTSTFPGSNFRKQIIAVRRDELETLRLLGRHLTRSRPGEPDEVRDLNDDEVGPTLAALFRLPLSGEEVGMLVATLAETGEPT
jgi:N-hydroxyarylamine O-acetyltransferase